MRTTQELVKNFESAFNKQNSRRIVLQSQLNHFKKMMQKTDLQISLENQEDNLLEDPVYQKLFGVYNDYKQAFRMMPGKGGFLTPVYIYQFEMEKIKEKKKKMLNRTMTALLHLRDLNK